MEFLTAFSVVWRHRDKALGVFVVLLIFAIHLLNGQVQSLEIALASKPRIETKIETRIETKIETRIVQGPERIVEKIIIKPSGEKIIERVVYRDRIITVSGTETLKDMFEQTESEPVVAMELLKSRSSRFLLGASFSPFQVDKLETVRIMRVGYSFQNRLDLTYGYDLWRPMHLAEVTLRF